MLGVLAPLLSLLGLETASIAGNFKRQAIVWGLIGVLGLVFVVFLLVAANSALTEWVGPVIAPLIIAVAAAVIAIVIYLVHHIRATIEARRQAEKERGAEVTTLLTTALLAAVPMILRSPLLKQVGIPAGAAIASALLLRKSPGRRHD